MNEQQQMGSLLGDYRVLDLSDQKGVLCGKLLADYGADVIKVEPPGGDPMRSIGPFYKDIPDLNKSLYWFTFNTNKRSITLDMWSQTGRIAHSFPDACRLLEELERRSLADGTLLYLPGFHAPYDTRMPAWEPAEALGGRARFRELVDRSKSVGAIVMPHTNFWGYDPASGLLQDWEEAWSGGQWLTGRVIKYMQLDHPRWIALFDRYFDCTVAEFGLECVFLDQCGNAFDQLACPGMAPTIDLVAGTRHLLERIHGKFPDLLLGSEVLNEQIVGRVPLFQSTWIAEEMIGHFSPVVRLMFAGRVRLVPHLFLTASVPCRYVYPHIHSTLIVEHGLENAFRWYQEYNRQMGGIPSVRLDYNRHGIDPISLQVLENA